MATRKNQGADEAANPVTTLTPEDSKERAFVVMKKYHHHGILGVLREGMPYHGPKHHFEQINQDFPGILEFTDEKGALEVAKKNREAAERAIAADRKAQEKADKDAAAKKGAVGNV